MSKDLHAKFVIHLLLGIGLFFCARASQSGAIAIPISTQQWGVSDRILYQGPALVAVLAALYCFGRAIWFLRGGGKRRA